jgi:tetratricopeptide (TPR) repeat protein
MPVQHYEISVNEHILADIDRACGDLAQAEAGYREALTIREQLLGPGNPDHPEIAAICANLATLLYQLGRHREAANLLGRAGRMTTRGLPDGHPVAASIRRDLRRYRSDRSTH